MDQPDLISMPWNVLPKILFRFCFLFFIFYIFFNPVGFFPYSDEVYEYYIIPFHHLIPWIGKHVLHLSYDITAFTNGSGDTTFDYLMLLLLIVLNIAGCLIWTVIDRRRTDYNILTYWLTIIIRYYLAFILIRYGFGKIFRRQFPAPGPFDLQESYGEASPMGLAWTFFGYSRGYNYFTGFFDTISGVLLLFRRTIRVGSVIALVVMVNIIAVNFCFDVCVKLFSTALGVMILYLLWQDRKGHVS